MGSDQPWEALDIDDSDIPSLLRPCKRPRPSAIPGPAAVVQSAMLRKTLDRKNQNHIDDNNCGLISTQDYIRKAVDDTGELDDDFTRQPWVSALQFLGAGEDVIPVTSISSIKKCTDVGEVVQVVAVIKSCTPNGLGGLIVTLKDSTGTVGATIHHKVLCESEFRKNLSVGSVLVLQKVAMLAPVRSAQYLNVTLRNLVKVFGKDSDSPSKQDSSAHTVQYAHPENSGKAKACQVMEDTTKKRQNTGQAEKISNHSLFQKQNLFARNSQSNRTSSDISAPVRTGHPELSQDACNETPENIIRKVDITVDQHESVNDGDQYANGSILEGGVLSNIPNIANPVAEGTAEEIQEASDIRMKRQPLIVKPSLPQWTDEQLDELFAGDYQIASSKKKL